LDRYPHLAMAFVRVGVNPHLYNQDHQAAVDLATIPAIKEGLDIEWTKHTYAHHMHRLEVSGYIPAAEIALPSSSPRSEFYSPARLMRSPALRRELQHWGAPEGSPVALNGLNHSAVYTRRVFGATGDATAMRALEATPETAMEETA
jgi:hypothetical protein